MVLGRHSNVKISIDQTFHGCKLLINASTAAGYKVQEMGLFLKALSRRKLTRDLLCLSALRFSAVLGKLSLSDSPGPKLAAVIDALGRSCRLSKSCNLCEARFPEGFCLKSGISYCRRECLRKDCDKIGAELVGKKTRKRARAKMMRPFTIGTFFAACLREAVENGIDESEDWEKLHIRANIFRKVMEYI